MIRGASEEHAPVLREGAEVSFAGRPSQLMTLLD
jgi:hypothetical protein